MTLSGYMGSQLDLQFSWVKRTFQDSIMLHCSLYRRSVDDIFAPESEFWHVTYFVPVITYSTSQVPFASTRDYIERTSKTLGQASQGSQAAHPEVAWAGSPGKSRNSISDNLLTCNSCPSARGDHFTILDQSFLQIMEVLFIKHDQARLSKQKDYVINLMVASLVTNWTPLTTLPKSHTCIHPHSCVFLWWDQEKHVRPINNSTKTTHSDIHNWMHDIY